MAEENAQPTNENWEVEMLAQAMGAPQPSTEAAETVQAATPTETQSTEQQTEQVAEQSQPEITPIEVKPAWDEFLKGKGFNSWEEIESKINTTPKFDAPNEVSKKVWEGVLNGKEEDLESVFYERKFFKEISKKDDESQLKAYIKLNNPFYDDELVQQEFDEKYKVDELADRLTQVRAKQRMQTDLDAAKQFFTSKLESLQLPNIQQDTVNDDLAEYGKQLVDNVSKVDNSKANIGLNYNDAKSGISFQVKFSDEKSFTNAKEVATGDGKYMDWYLGRYFPNGQPNGEMFIQDMYRLENFDKILQAAVSQAVEQTRIATLKKDKNIEQPINTTEAVSSNAYEEALAKAFFG